MTESRNPGGLPYPSFVRSLSGPLGCLAVLVLLPIALLTLLFVSATGLFGSAGGQGATRRRRPRTKEEADQEIALCSLVQAMALDDVFTREDAQTAGVMTTAGRTLDEMLDEARGRDWIENRDERMAVTDRGRKEATAYLRSMDLA